VIGRAETVRRGKLSLVWRLALLGRIVWLAFAHNIVVSAQLRPVVTLTVEERAGVERCMEPVTSGVPLPRGVVDTPRSLVLVDEQMHAVQANVKAVTRWSDAGGLRWVHLHFQTNLPAYGKRVYTLVVTDSHARPTKERVKVTDQRDRFIVSTGPLRFAIRKSGFNGIDEAWLDSSGRGRFTPLSRVIAPHQWGLLMRASGTEYRSSLDRQSRVEVEELTPLYVIIKASGTMCATSGSKGFSYVCRLTAYAGKPQVAVQVTVVNIMGPRREDSVPLERLCWALPAVMGKQRRVLLGGESGVYQANLHPGETAWLYQSSSDDFRVGGVLTGSGKGKTTRPLTTGWAALDNGTLGVTGGVRWFWQLYPKALEVTGEGLLRMDLYSDRAKPLDIYTGVARTHDLLLYFYDRATPVAKLRDAFAAFQRPLQAVASPRWYCRDSKAFGNLVDDGNILSVEGQEAFRKYLEWWTTNFDNIKRIRDGQQMRGVYRDAYGWLEFGDGWHYVWQPGNSDPRNLAWDGNYYDFPHACLLHFLVTGRWDFFDFFVEHVRHLGDVHLVHYDPDPTFIGSNRYCPPTDHVRMDPEESDYRTAKVYVSNTFNHHKTLSLFESYLLTGDRSALKAALMALQFAFEYKSADNAYNQPRGPGNQLLTLLAGYEFTGDRKYLDRCLRIIEAGKQAQHNNGPAFAPRRGQYFQVGILLEALIKYHNLTKDKSVIPMVKKAMDFFIVGKYLFTNCAQAAGFLYEVTGQKEYLNYGLRAVTRTGVFEHAIKESGLNFRSAPYFFYYVRR